MSRQIHDENTLIDIYKLSGYDMDRIILNEGQIGLAFPEKCFYIYLPSLNEYVRYPPHLHEKLNAKLTPDQYRLSLADTVLKIAAPNNLAPTSLLVTDHFLPLVDRYIDVGNDTMLMISSRRSVPVFVGNSKIITRLADDFDSLEATTPVIEFEKWRQAYVRS